MKQRIRIIVCACTVCIAAIMVSLTAASFRPESDTAQVPPEEIHTARSGFVIMEHGGRIAVFDQNDLASPLTVTNIRVSSLRESDRQLLSTGLEAENEAQLAQLLEDLGS